MAHRNDTKPATKADIRGLQTRLDQHDDQFKIILKLLSKIQNDTQTVRRDLRALADKLLDNHERRLLACEQRLDLVS